MASEFIGDQFEKQNTSEREMFVHLTCAKDVLNMNNVFRSVKDILKNTIEKNFELF
jgi:hypothetical protein